MATSKRARTRSTTPGAGLRPPSDPPSAAAKGAAPGQDPAATIAEILADLTRNQARLTELIDAADPDDVPTLIRLFSVYSQNATRMGRLLRDQRALSGAAADGLAGAIAQALDELSSELGREL
jgi:hypothetical protein